MMLRTLSCGDHVTFQWVHETVDPWPEGELVDSVGVVETGVIHHWGDVSVGSHGQRQNFAPRYVEVAGYFCQVEAPVQAASIFRSVGEDFPASERGL